MRKKAVNSYFVQILIGVIFTAVGLPFLFIGIYFALHMPWLTDTAQGTGDVRILPLIFTLLGGIISVIGLAFLIWVIRKKRAIKKVIQGGHTVSAVISEISINYSVEVNGRNPYVIVCQYQDPVTGILHIFRSGNIMFNPGDLTHREVSVFVDPQNFNHYYVDLESVLPEVEMH